jgi:hypothetical protein
MVHGPNWDAAKTGLSGIREQNPWKPMAILLVGEIRPWTIWLGTVAAVSSDPGS